MKKKTFIVQLLDSKKPSRTSFTQVEDANFYSNDTDASLIFIPHEDSFDFQSAKVVMYNRGDESLVERDMQVTTEDDRKVASYEMPDEIISHWGDWTAQPVFISGGEIYSGSIVPFSVIRYLMDNRPPTLRDVIKIDELYSQLVTVMDEIAGKDVISAPEIILARGEFNTLGARLDETTAQLAQTDNNLNQKVGNGKLATMADMGQDVKEALTGGSVSVVGKDTVLEENIVNGQVTVNKTDFLKYGKNKFNPKNAKDGFSQTALGEESPDALWSLSEFIPVVSGTTYSLTPENTSYKRPTFHDVNYDFVELIHAGSNIITQMTYTPTQNGYVRIPVLTDGKYSFSFTVTTESSAFEPFTIEGNDNLLVKPKPDSVGDEELKDNSIGVGKLTFAETSKNLFNKNSPDIEKDKTVGSTAVTPIYDTSEYIPITSGETYAISHPRRYQTSNSNKTANEWSDWLNNEPVTFTADRDGFLKVTYLKTNTDYLQIEKGNAPTSYEPYGTIKIPNLHIETPTSENVLRGKRLVGFGDSIGQGGGNVVNGKGRGYIEIIAEQNYMTHKNYSIGGATIAKREGYEHLEINTQIDTAIADGEVADYIVFNGLTNDASATPISRKGEITDSYDGELDLNTFAGMFEEICRKLKVNFITSKIIYVRVHNMSSRGSQQIEYGELATEICRKYSIPVVDLFNEGGLNTQMVEMTNLYTNNADSTHPNELGYRMFYVPRIETKMMSV